MSAGTQSSRYRSTIAPEIVLAVPAEGVEKVKIDLVPLRDTRSILTFSTPSAGTACTISGPADTIHSKIDEFQLKLLQLIFNFIKLSVAIF